MKLNTFHFQVCHTGAKILNLSKNSHFENLTFHKIQFQSLIFPKNSHFQNLIFHKIHIFKVSFSQNSQFQSLIFNKIHNFKASSILLTKFVCPSHPVSPEAFDLGSWNFVCVIYTPCGRFLRKKISEKSKKKFWNFSQTFFRFFYRRSPSLKATDGSQKASL